MKNGFLNRFLVGLFVLAICFPLLGQDSESLTLPREVRLNERQPPDSVLKAIGIEPGMIIGEVGAGRGRYTVHIAARVGPTGKVYANDIEESYLLYLKNRCEGLGFDHVETIVGGVTDPNLPAGALDMVIMVNVVHCLAEPVELLRNIKKSLKSDGVIAIVEGNLDKEPSAAGEWYSRSKLLGIYRDAGYELVREETFLPSDNIYILK